MDEAYHAIIAHDDSYLEKIDKIMDNVEAIHYGNKNAALSRVLYFAAEIGTKLFQYQLIEGDYNEMQEKLQKEYLGEQPVGTCMKVDIPGTDIVLLHSLLSESLDFIG